MFCSYCGAKVSGDMKFCGACGKPIDIIYEEGTSNTEEPTPINGEPAFSPEELDYSYEEPNFSNGEADSTDAKSDATKMQPFFSGFMDKASETASKAVDQAKNIASQTKEKIEQSSDKELEKAIKKSESKNKLKEGLVSSNYRGSNYMSTSELWTWLKKDSKRQQFYTEGGYDESEEEYIEDLRNKIEHNSVPVDIEKRKICWDRSDAVEQVYVVLPKTNVVNPLTYLVQFSHVGDFTFVEEKTFITPPDLPEKPGEKLTLPKGIAMLMAYLGLIAVIFLLVTLFVPREAGVFILFAFILGVIDVALYMKYAKIFDYNKRCDEQLKKWNEAWDNWKTSIFLHSFQEDINGQLSRIFDSVYSSINQLNNEKFGDKKVLDVQDESRMNEMEELISRKREEYR